MKYKELKDLAEEWVSDFNSYPRDMIKALIEAAYLNANNPDEEARNTLYQDHWEDVTPPAPYDRVYISCYTDYSEDEDGEQVYDVEGEIKEYNEESGTYTIVLDGGKKVELEEHEFDDIERSYIDADCQDGTSLPMYGTMWSFNSSLEKSWIENGNGLRALADCGFRVFYSETFDKYFFGIHGCNYSFYGDCDNEDENEDHFDGHWTRLYLAKERYFDSLFRKE